MALILSAFAPLTSFADILQIHPTQDATANAGDPNTNYNGTTLTLSGENAAQQRAYLEFDIGAEGVCGTINTAAVFIKQFGKGTNPGNYTNDIHLANTTFDETTLTYNNAPTFQSTVIDAKAIPADGVYGQWDITGLSSDNPITFTLQDTLDFVLKYSNETGGSNDYSQYRSQSYGTPTDRPYLEIDYTPGSCGGSSSGSSSGFGTSTIIYNPNQDFANGMWFFLFGFGFIILLFKGRK